MAWTILDFGLTGKRLEKVKKDIEINRIDVKRRILELEKNLKGLLRDMEENDKKISIYSNAVSVSRKRYNISQKQFDLGVITTLDLLTSEAELNSTEISYINAIINYKTKLSEIQRDYRVEYTE